MNRVGLDFFPHLDRVGKTGGAPRIGHGHTSRTINQDGKGPGVLDGIVNLFHPGGACEAKEQREKESAA